MNSKALNEEARSTRVDVPPNYIYFRKKRAINQRKNIDEPMEKVKLDCNLSNNAISKIKTKNSGCVWAHSSGLQQYDKKSSDHSL